MVPYKILSPASSVLVLPISAPQGRAAVPLLAPWGCLLWTRLTLMCLSCCPCSAPPSSSAPIGRSCSLGSVTLSFCSLQTHSVEKASYVSAPLLPCSWLPCCSQPLSPYTFWNGAGSYSAQHVPSSLGREHGTAFCTHSS